jgi:hypothetical protein
MVRAEGKPGTDACAANKNYGSRQYRFIERANYAEMHDFVVYLRILRNLMN